MIRDSGSRGRGFDSCLSPLFFAILSNSNPTIGRVADAVAVCIEGIWQNDGCINFGLINTRMILIFKEILVQDHFYRKYSQSQVFLNWIICLPLLMMNKMFSLFMIIIDSEQRLSVRLLYMGCYAF